MKPGRFVSSTDPRVCERIERARQFNDQLDAVDRKRGGATPAECPIDVGLRTVMSAMEAGMGREDWDCIAEAFCMLQDIELRVRR